ncbi:aromatic ring-hydroxylating dioxygenase subunit alpha [Nocardia puris]|uniref:Phenylpropionate dioxygenase-like ring-hydroxylating dioxygenase large terminal subunit n=1 Tax=Nocardia puris TaxID=208602 RepID=A0A366DUU3_9NOCA|nr:aromatic ring-hydroxylating dioxygenase subunit alpha [Nocardia puris]MBF6210267.1 aromatic ring-hydroxylating dioxygenase subunit alpha [Nocardia puris]MBF6367343.1 aromatic ring-hydroxylating dioxygenase subunit alpha [Nocardia puris]MBF6457528.1 aromatic ring-hydroxylating dioxygenase subunit alpha [Nocardia puris]RBO93685.1 phenylpropionate dioxygenase-like ring-hydroxylating dioxygenase large terminal subunit [Nocardia puris]
MPVLTRIDDILTDLRAYLGDDAPALSLPPAAYTSPELWELECERIFHRSWFLVAHTDQLAAPGDYVAVSVAGEMAVVVRDGDGVLRGHSPVCRHRLMPLVEPGAGNTAAFTCRYHLWKYGLDGRLRGAPYMAENKEFRADECRLPGFAVAEWNGFVWLNLDARAEPVAAHLDLIAPHFAGYRLDRMVQVDSWSLEWRANWKLVMENGHENYHVLGLHRETLQPFMPGGGDIHVEVASPWMLHLRIPLAMSVDSAMLSLDDVQRAHAMVGLAFPASAFIALADQVVWLTFLPSTIDSVRVLGGVLTLPELAVGSADLARTQQAVTAMINDEDRSGLEAVQRGAGSRYAERGHLSPKERPGVLAFYRDLAHALLDDGPWPGTL